MIPQLLPAMLFDDDDAVVYYASEFQSVYYQCLLACQDVIDSLDLSGSPTCVIRKAPVDRNLGLGKDVTLPAIILAPQREEMNAAAGISGMADVPYGIWCVLIAANNQATLTGLETILEWRQAIARAFRNQPLDDVSQVGTFRVKYGDVVHPEAWNSGLLASVLLLVPQSREELN